MEDLEIVWPSDSECGGIFMDCGHEAGMFAVETFGDYGDGMMYVSFEDAKKLRDWLTQWIEEQEGA